MPLDEHRVWGWRLVNFAKYRAIRNEDDRKEQNRIAQAKWRERNASKPRKPISAHTEAEAEAEEIAPTVLVGKPDVYRPPDCPFQELVAAYHALCPSLSQVRVLTNMRMKHTRARWVEVAVGEKWAKDETMQWFEGHFRRAEASHFLTGRVKSNGARVWKADFEWLMTAGNFAKVVEGRYDNERAA